MPVNVEDINGVVSSAFYADPLDRQTKIIRASNTSLKNQTTFIYSDGNHIISALSDLNSYGDNLLAAATIYDELGRTIESRVYEDVINYIATRQNYDVLGRAYQASNPFRPARPGSPPLTTLWGVSLR